MDRYELYYNYAHSQIQEQNERIKAIQARVMNLMALNLALLGVFGLMLPDITMEMSLPQILEMGLSPSQMLEMGLSPSQMLEMAFSLVVVGASAVSIFYSLKTLHLGRWHTCPKLDNLQRNIQNMDHTTEQIVEWTIEGMAESYRLNAEILDEGGRYLIKAMGGFWFAVAFLVILMASINLW